jgi:hypothetical protein
MLAFKQSPGFENLVDTQDQSGQQPADLGRIRCPLCHWQPRPGSRWYCTDVGHPEYFFAGCGTAWNTFQTAGLCPGCGHQWRYTACMRCGQMSLHQDWYAKGPADS